MNSNILKSSRLKSVNCLLIIGVAFVFVNTTCQLVFYMLPQNSLWQFAFYIFKMLSIIVLVRPLIAAYLRGVLYKDRADLFYIYSNIFNKYFLMSIIKHLILLAFCTVTLLPYGFINEYYNDNRVLRVIMVFSCIFSLFLNALFYYRFVLCDILILDKNITPVGAIKQSFKMTKGKLYYYLKLNLKYIFLLPLCIFIIPAFYIFYKLFNNTAKFYLFARQNGG